MSRFYDFQMSALNSEEVNTNMLGDEIHGLCSHEVEDADNAASSSSVSFMTEEVTRQIKTATDPLTKQLEKLCNLINIKTYS